MSSSMNAKAGRCLHRSGLAVLLLSFSACATDTPTAPTSSPAPTGPVAPAPPSGPPASPGASTLSLSRTDVVFNAAAGATLRDSAAISVSATSGKPITELQALTYYGGGQPEGWLSITVDEAAVPATVILRATSASLSPGEYTATVRLAAPGVAPDSLSVTTRVVSGAAIGLNAAKICFTTSLGDDVERRDDIRVTSIDGSVIDGLSATIAYDDVDHAGWLKTSFDRTTTPARLWLRTDLHRPPAGTYTATVTVASSTAGSAPPIHVTLTVNPSEAVKASRLYVHIQWEDPQNGGLATIWGTNGIYCKGGEYGCIGYLESGVGDLSLTPDADYGARFRRWTGACTGSAGCTVHFTTPGTDQHVTAVYGARPTYVTLALRGDRASGTVTVSPPVTATGTGEPMRCRLENGVAQGKCEGQLVSGAGTFTVTATPDPGSVFVDWQLGGQSGDRSQLPGCAPAAPSCTFTLTFNGNYVSGVVTFASGSDRSLEVQVQGQGLVSWPYPPGGDCPLFCKRYFEPGSTVTLEAHPAEGMTFGGWINCPTASGTSCTVPMSLDRIVVARFTEPPSGEGWELVVNLYGTGGWGSVALQSAAGSNPEFCIWSGSVQAGPCRMKFPASVQEARLIAAPAGGTLFNRWIPACSGGSLTECVVTAPTEGTGTVTVEGEFAPLLPPNNVIVSVLGDGASGYVQARVPGSNPEIGTGLGCTLSNGNMSGACEATSGNGTIEFTATPVGASRFVQWSGACLGTDPRCSITFTGGQTANVIATFAVSN